MNNILISGGWFIWPLLVCSILLISIVIERLWFLQRRLVAPKGLQRQVQNLINKNAFHAENQEEISATSQLGELLYSGARGVPKCQLRWIQVRA